VNLDLLRIASDRGVRLDLDPNLIPPRFLDGGKRQQKMEGVLKRMRAKQDFQMRVHPTWYVAKTGRITCQNPNILILPFEFFESSPNLLKDISATSLEVIVTAKLLGITELADLLIGNPTSNATDLLLKEDALKGLLPPEGDPERKAQRSEFKMGLYMLLYGRRGQTLTQCHYQDKIKAVYPSLPIPRGREETEEENEERKAFIGQIHASVTALTLTVADMAEKSADCKVVGFCHDEVLIEYTGDSPEEAAARLRTLSYDMLRSWSGVPVAPFSYLQEV